MSKRRQDKQLTKDNYDEGSGSEDDNPSGGFQFASEEQLKGRQIVKPRSTRKSKKEKNESTPLNTEHNVAPVLKFDFSDSSTLDSFTPFSTTTVQEAATNGSATSGLEKRLAALESEVTALRQRVAKLERKPSAEEASAPVEAASAKFDFSFPSELTTPTPASASGSLSWEQFANTENTASDFSKIAGTGETPAWTDNSNYVVPDLEEKAPKSAVALAPAEPVSTGEEDEENVVTCRTKLYTLTPKETEGDEKPEGESSEQKSEAQMEWKETGVGNLKLNKLANGKGRLIMRTDTTFRLILNTLVFPEMSVKKPSDKQILLVAVDEHLKPKSHMIKFQNAQQTTELFEKIEQFKKEMAEKKE